jgi:DNA-binding beta-propeller fold protein YncE
MSLRKLLFLSIVAVLYIGRPAFSQTNDVMIAGDGTAQVIDGKHPVVQVMDAEGKVMASIPIEKSPGGYFYIYSKSANTLYVVYNEKKHEHFISAVNLTTNRVDKQIKVGAGRYVGLFLSNDGRRLYCYTAANSGIRQPGPASGYIYSEYLDPPYEPAITVIDTASNQIIVTYNWFKSFQKDVNYSHSWGFNMQFIAVTDDGKLVIKSKAVARYGLNSLIERFVIFSGIDLDPISTIDTSGQVVGSMLSKDQKLVFAAVAGDKKTDGSLIVINLEKGTSITHALTDHPTGLIRLGSKREPWILSSEKMRVLSETGELGERQIQLSLDGVPNETISLDDDHAAILIRDKHKVILLDMKKLQVDAIVATRSLGEKVGIASEQIMAATMTGVILGALDAVIVATSWDADSGSIMARRDGQILYVFDPGTHKVTVIDVRTATIVRRISVNEYITRIKVSSDGKQLICAGSVSEEYARNMNLNFSGPVRETINLETNNF